MSADVLREAAKLMRERADTAAVRSGVPDWYAPNAVGLDGIHREDRDHIASWHPAVALAVADWLDNAAEQVEGAHAPATFAQYDPTMILAFAVANAYLGTAP